MKRMQKVVSGIDFHCTYYEYSEHTIIYLVGMFNHQIINVSKQEFKDIKDFAFTELFESFIMDTKLDMLEDIINNTPKITSVKQGIKCQA